jgi:hypothetical protein
MNHICSLLVVFGAIFGVTVLNAQTVSPLETLFAWGPEIISRLENNTRIIESLKQKARTGQVEDLFLQSLIKEAREINLRPQQIGIFERIAGDIPRMNEGDRRQTFLLADQAFDRIRGVAIAWQDEINAGAPTGTQQLNDRAIEMEFGLFLMAASTLSAIDIILQESGPSLNNKDLIIRAQDVFNKAWDLYEETKYNLGKVEKFASLVSWHARIADNSVFSPFIAKLLLQDSRGGQCNGFLTK